MKISDKNRAASFSKLRLAIAACSFFLFFLVWWKVPIKPVTLDSVFAHVIFLPFGIHFCMTARKAANFWGRIDGAIGTFFEWVVTLLFFGLIVYLVVWGIGWVASNVGAIPVSIVIGALIIALAIRKSGK